MLLTLNVLTINNIQTICHRLVNYAQKSIRHYLKSDWFINKAYFCCIEQLFDTSMMFHSSTYP